MDDRILGSILIIVGIVIAASFGRTMSTPIEAAFYIGGFFIAFIGLGLLAKYWKRTKE